MLSTQRKFIYIKENNLQINIFSVTDALWPSSKDNGEDYIQYFVNAGIAFSLKINGFFSYSHLFIIRIFCRSFVDQFRAFFFLIKHFLCEENFGLNIVRKTVPGRKTAFSFLLSRLE